MTKAVRGFDWARQWLFVVKKLRFVVGLEVFDRDSIGCRLVVQVLHGP